jgi:hypothetical protein
MNPLKTFSSEWIAEAERAPLLLQAALNDPHNPAVRNAAFESLGRLGFLKPIDAKP